MRALSKRRARRAARCCTSRVMRGGLPSSTSIGMSTGDRSNSGSRTVEPPAGVDLADHRERAALARGDGGELRQRLGRDREHVALLRLVAPQLERRHAGSRRSGWRAGRCARRGRLCATASGTAFDSPPAPTSWISAIGLRSPSAQQRSMTSCARRCISALPRCTEAKSRSALELPLPSEEAAPPPRPISIAGPPSTTSCAPDRHLGLLDVRAAHVAEAAGDHDRLVVAAHALRTIARRPAARRCGNSRRSPAARTRC